MCLEFQSWIQIKKRGPVVKNASNGDTDIEIRFMDTGEGEDGEGETNKESSMEA